MDDTLTIDPCFRCGTGIPRKVGRPGRIAKWCGAACRNADRTERRRERVAVRRAAAVAAYQAERAQRQAQFAHA